MENNTSCIVKVTPLHTEGVEYQFEKEIRRLSPGEEFLGYFWQILTIMDKDAYRFAYIHKIKLIDSVNGIFKYEGQAIFVVKDIQTTLVARRGPNKYFGKRYKKLPEWNPNFDPRIITIGRK